NLAPAVWKPLEVCIVAHLGNGEQHVFEGLPRHARQERLAQDLPVLRFRRAPVARRADLELANNLLFEVAYHQLASGSPLTHAITDTTQEGRPMPASPLVLARPNLRWTLRPLPLFLALAALAIGPPGPHRALAQSSPVRSATVAPKPLNLDFEESEPGQPP